MGLLAKHGLTSQSEHGAEERRCPDQSDSDSDGQSLRLRRNECMYGYTLLCM